MRRWAESIDSCMRLWSRPTALGATKNDPDLVVIDAMPAMAIIYRRMCDARTATGRSDDRAKPSSSRRIRRAQR
jgi:hypothetical protein